MNLQDLISENEFFIRNLNVAQYDGLDELTNLDEYKSEFLDKIRKLNFGSNENRLLQILAQDVFEEVYEYCVYQTFVECCMNTKWMTANGFFFPVNFDQKEKYYEDPEAGYVINTFDVIISANLHAIYQVRHNGKVYFDEHQEEILQFWADYIIDILRRNKRQADKFIIGNKLEFDLQTEGYVFPLDMDEDTFYQTFNEAEINFYILQQSGKDYKIEKFSNTYNNGGAEESKMAFECFLKFYPYTDLTLIANF